jgi:hypothetical protein
LHVVRLAGRTPRNDRKSHSSTVSTFNAIYMPDESEIPSEIPQQLSPRAGKPRNNVLVASSLFAAFIIILGAVVYQNSRYYSKGSSPATPSATASPTPAAIGAAANLSFKQQFELAIQKRNATICTEAIPLFAAALADGTTLSKDDQARAWFWKALCEYELKQNAAALASFQAVKNMGLSMATSVDVWTKFAGQK